MKYDRLIITALGLGVALGAGAQPQRETTTSVTTAVVPSQPAPAQGQYSQTFNTTTSASSQASGSQGQAPQTPSYQQNYVQGMAGAGATGNFFGTSGSRMANSFVTWTSDDRNGGGPVSVINFKSPDQKVLDETAEDLNIMSLIFSKNLERALGGEDSEAEGYKLGIPMLLQTSGHLVEASYLEGFGAVFNLKVRFPLVSAAVSDKETNSSQLNSEWEQARRALTGGGPAESRRQPRWDTAKNYSPKLVETLKQRVLELLKNASNLRHVQPDEWVTVAISGPPNVRVHQEALFGVRSQAAPGEELGVDSLDGQPAAGQGVVKSGRGAGAGGGGAEAAAGTPGPVTAGGNAKQTVALAPPAPDRSTIMTIRVHKKDADAFAAMKMTQEQFLQAAEVASYLGPVILNGTANDYMFLQTR